MWNHLRLLSTPTLCCCQGTPINEAKHARPVQFKGGGWASGKHTTSRRSMTTRDWSNPQELTTEYMLRICPRVLLRYLQFQTLPTKTSQIRRPKPPNNVPKPLPNHPNTSKDILKPSRIHPNNAKNILLAGFYVNPRVSIKVQGLLVKPCCFTNPLGLASNTYDVFKDQGFVVIKALVF